MKTYQVPVADIQVRGQHRALNPAVVEQLAASMAALGLRQPITVRFVAPVGGEDAATLLVAGQHRLAAAKALGWEQIEARAFEGDDELDCELWQIAENLHRAELTPVEASEQVARWVELVGQREARRKERALASDRQEAGISQQVAAEISEGAGEPAPKRSRGRPESATAAAAREFNMSKDAVRRAMRIAAIPEEAKEAARAAGLDDNQSALLEVARAKDPVAKVADIAAEREKRKAQTRTNAAQREAAAEGEAPARVPAIPGPAADQAAAAPRRALKDLQLVDRKGIQDMISLFNRLSDEEAQMFALARVWALASMEVRASALDLVRAEEAA